MAARPAAEHGGGAGVRLFYGFEEWTFPLEALERPPDAVNVDTEQAQALRGLIAAAGAALPMTGWRELLATELAAIFAAGVFEEGLTVAWFEWFEPRMIHERVAERSHGDPEGRWISRGVRTNVTHLGVAPPPGTSRAVWWPDPAARSPRRSRRLKLLATDPHCASGRPTGDRLLPPVVEEQPDAVMISFAATRLTGSQTCPTHPPTPYTVILDAPLGTRRLLDAGSWPPRQPDSQVP